MAVTLKVGDQAPEFTATDQRGKTVSLSDFLGKKVVLFFYPQSGTPTCTVQSCNLRDHFSSLKRKGFVIIGVSPDSVTKQKNFSAKHELPYPILADEAHDVLEKYGVWDQKKTFGIEYMGVLRTTFLIDETGIIRHIFLKPKSKMHSEEILAVAKEIGLAGGK